MANPAAAAQHQARGGDGATGRPAAERAQGTSSPQRRSCCAQRRAAGQHRGGRHTAPGSAANATHLDRRGLSPSLATAPRRERAATASIAGRRPAHSSNVHRDEGACRVYSLAGFTGPFLFSRDTLVLSVELEVDMTFMSKLVKSSWAPCPKKSSGTEFSHPGDPGN